MILQAELTRTVGTALRRTLDAGATVYDRRRMLPRLIAADPEIVGDETPEGRRRVLRLLGRALRGERCRGRAGHWTYSLDRHIGLVQAIRAEGRALAAQRRAGAVPDRIEPLDRSGLAPVPRDRADAFLPDRRDPIGGRTPFRVEGRNKS